MHVFPQASGIRGSLVLLTQHRQLLGDKGAGFETRNPIQEPIGWAGDPCPSFLTCEMGTPLPGFLKSMLGSDAPGEGLGAVCWDVVNGED